MPKKRSSPADKPAEAPSRFHVALIVESSRGYGRGLLWGIARWVRTHGPWSISWQDRGLGEPAPLWLKSWKGHGIIARAESTPMIRAVLDKGLPTINLRGGRDWPTPLLETDDAAVAQLAFEHLAERGFRNFAYCGFAEVAYSQRRQEAFMQCVARAGHPCQAYSGSLHGRRGSQQYLEQHGLLYETDVVDWVRSLPKPVGIMACNDLRGQQLLNACRACGTAVPDEAAVIGVDNDRLLCELSDPPLSSVEADAPRIGFEAASLLDELMRGGRPPKAPRLIPPQRVVTRQSTDVLAVDDPDVALAVRFIRENACRGITVEDLMREVPLTQTVLKRRFEKYLGHSPKAEIIRVRLAQVKQLLCETDLSLDAIARRTGFEHPEYLSALFKEKTGQTPGQYRRDGQLTGGGSDAGENL